MILTDDYYLEVMVQADMAKNGFNPYDENDIKLYWEELLNDN